MSDFENRERVEGMVRALFSGIKRWFPAEYDAALDVASKLDQERWSGVANERLAERDRLNNTPWGHS